MIHLENVEFSYTGDGKADLDNISLHVSSGECLLLAGISGCGKTTLLRVINGLIPRHYCGRFRGNVKLAGKNLGDYTKDDLYIRVGCVLQNSRSQFFNIDTTSEIAFGCENLGWSREEIHRRVEETAAVLGITHLLDRDILSLSGGEKQKIAIASVYAAGVEVFILDEPSANLDVAATEELKQVIAGLKRKGKTVVVAEHRLFYLKDLVDRILYLKKGRIAEEWSPEQLLSMTTADFHDRGLRAPGFDDLSFETCTGTGTRGKTFSIFDLEVAYTRKKPVLKGITTRFNQGEITGVIGHNGQGKSTLARCLCGMIREREGSMTFYDIPYPYKKRLGRIYLVMQDSSYQLFSNSVSGELKFSRRTGKTENDYTNDEILELLSLSELKERHPISLSGGEKQRLAIAAGMVQNSEIIILDEPTSGLDYINMLRIRQVLLLLRDKGILVAVITHDLEFLLRTCDRVIAVESGPLTAEYPINVDHTPDLKSFFKI